MTKTQQLTISIPFSALFLRVTTNEYNYVMYCMGCLFPFIVNRVQFKQLDYHKFSQSQYLFAGQYIFLDQNNPIFLEQELSSTVQVRVLANFLLRAFNNLQNFFEATFFFVVPRIYPLFLKKIKINKIKSIGKISGIRNNIVQRKTTTTRRSGGLTRRNLARVVSEGVDNCRPAVQEFGSNPIRLDLVRNHH